MRLAAKLASRDLAYVMPVLDSGRDAESDSYFIVMPRADFSLQDTLDKGTRYSEGEAVEILRQIAQALDEVKDIVHRDLKPGNVLWHEGGWKVADFGIARFVEEATSSRTLKDCLSPHYAAPEQWEALRATTSADL
jgi:serine/threonine protein kinase